MKEVKLKLKFTKTTTLQQTTKYVVLFLVISNDDSFKEKSKHFCCS